MKYQLLLILILMSCSFKNELKLKTDSSIFQKEKIELHFNLIQDRIENYTSWRKPNEGFYATLILTNRDDSILEIPKMLIYGHKGEGDYIAVHDFSGKEIDVNNQAHYQWLFWMEDEYFTTLKPDESKLDTISMDSFYTFKEKGDFKLRYVYLSSEDTLYSNWDTLEVY